MPQLYDRLAKQISQQALAPVGTTVVHAEINPETQYADVRHEPDPLRQPERDRLGLLGQLAAMPCLIEVYNRPPSAAQFRACLSKHLAVWRQRARKARAQSKKDSERGYAEDAPASCLWIISAGAPISLITKLALEASPGWPAGVYLFGDDILRVGIVVAGELPRNRKTLLVRLVAGGPLLASATKELAKLPPDAYERIVAEPHLIEFERMLRQSDNHDPDEQEFLMEMMTSWEEGKAEARADDVLTVLKVRGIAVPESTRARVLAEKDMKRLMRWLEKSVVASSIADVIDERK